MSRQQLWNKYKSVFQRRQQSRVRGQRNFRCCRALFEKQIYVLERRFDPEGEHSVVAGDSPLALCRPDRAREGGQEDPDEGAIIADLPHGVWTRSQQWPETSCTLPCHCPRTCRCPRKVALLCLGGEVGQALLVKTIATEPRHKTS